MFFVFPPATRRTSHHTVSGQLYSYNGLLNNLHIYNNIQYTPMPSPALLGFSLGAVVFRSILLINNPIFNSISSDTVYEGCQDRARKPKTYTISASSSVRSKE